MTARAAPRSLLPQLARGLIAYGIVGLVLAVLTSIAVLIAIGRLGTIGKSTSGSTDQVGTVLERMATVLDDAATSAGSFGATIDSSSAALTSAAVDLRAVVPQLRDIERQANAINILGSPPLAPLAGLFGGIADQLGDLDSQLDGVAADLVANRSALAANATSLRALATEVRALGARIAPTTIARIVDDATWLAFALLAVVVTGVGLPAGAALAGGWWLRREILRSAGSTRA